MLAIGYWLLASSLITSNFIIMRNFRKLNVWILGMEIVKDIYLLTKDLPAYEQYGLTNQIRRAAISIPSNIAEGSSRKTNPDFARFLEVALGSSFEIETQLLIANELNYLKIEQTSDVLNKLSILQKQVNALITKVRS
jgi:four helix bundle protein